MGVTAGYSMAMQTYVQQVIKKNEGISIHPLTPPSFFSGYDDTTLL